MHSPFFPKRKLPNGLSRRRISPRATDEQGSSMNTSYSVKSKNKKYARRLYHCQKCQSISQKSAQEISELKRLVNEFLSKKFSAAGVSYIVRSRSRWRKMLWLTAVIVALTFMGYMTYNVVKEYMNFPKMLIREEKISPKLPFPAVTLCSLNPIIQINNKSSVHKLAKLKDLLADATVVQSNNHFCKQCYRHPLCQWSWFDEVCTCVKNPCSTEFCLAENSTHCACALNLCRGFNLTFCALDRRRRCICLNSVQYHNPLEDQNYRTQVTDDKDWVDSIDESVRNVMKLIREATTYDLVDIEEALMPTVEDLFYYGVKFDNLIVSCSFDGGICHRENFTVLYHPTYGRCYMFNYLGLKPSSEEPVQAYNYGSSSGLRLILHVRKQDTIDILNSEVGARIVMHDPYELPFVAENGINLRPHDMSAVEVKQTIIERLKQPYGNCVMDGRHLKFSLTREQRYSILGCQKACRHHYLWESCNCTKRIYFVGSTFLGLTNYNFCKVENEIQYLCMTTVISRIEKGNITCDCWPPCKEKLYSTTVSSSELNENYYKAVKSIRTFHADQGVHKIVNATDRNLMVGVKVYYSTFQVDSDKEQASYSWETLIANIGGNLGFFMGLTLLTFMEVLEFLWDIIIMTVRRYADDKT